MAAHAIGDVEALLQGSDIGDGAEDGATSFEDRILSLVLSALAGKNVEEEARLAERSIDEAKEVLEREEENINAMLGSMDGAEYVGPRAPNCPASSARCRQTSSSCQPSNSWRPNNLETARLLSCGGEWRRRVYSVRGAFRHRHPQHGLRARLRRFPAAHSPGHCDSASMTLTISTAIRSQEVSRSHEEWVEGFGAKPTSIEHDEVRRLLTVPPSSGCDRLWRTDSYGASPGRRSSARMRIIGARRASRRCSSGDERHRNPECLVWTRKIGQCSERRRGHIGVLAPLSGTA